MAKTKKGSNVAQSASEQTSQKSEVHQRKGSSSEEIDTESIVKKKKIIKEKNEEKEIAPDGLLKDEDPKAALTQVFLLLRQTTPIIKILILLAVCILSFSIRIFSVLKFESVIHEYDPWFQFRSTKFMLENGVYGFWNWYDSESWHPLGRVVGGTVFPGIMFTSCTFKWILDFLAFPLDIRNICVFMAPFCSMFQSISAYLLAKECTNRPDAGLFSALFMAIVPSIISRGVAGSYDNEAVAIWALVNTFYLWVKAINTGAIGWSIMCSLNFFYMVASWGGYSFIINIIPVFVLGTIFINRFNLRIYVAYSVFYTFGSLLAMLVPFVNFQVIRSSEHLGSHFTFIIMNLFVLAKYIQQNLEAQQVAALIRLVGFMMVLGFFGLFFLLTMTGATKFSGRSMTLIDPSYASEHMPLVASVSEHAPTTWTNFFYDLGPMIIFLPIGYYYCLVHKATHGKLFMAMYGVFAAYFSSVMIRLMLVLAPAVCVISGIAVSNIVRKSTKAIRLTFIGVKNEDKEEQEQVESKKNLAFQPAKIKKEKPRRMPIDMALVVLAVTYMIVKKHVYHSNNFSASSYSSPSFIMDGGRDGNGDRIIIDDFREAYYWIKQNTPKESKILSWWDYGYQLSGMSNRTVIVDNNTWNNTHIATVGRALASNEEDGWKIAKSLDAKYVLVVFGGLVNYSGDDFAKFLWFVRIAHGEFPDAFEETDFYGPNGGFNVDSDSLSEKMANTLTYKMMFYRFGEMYTVQNQPHGFDRARRREIGHKDIQFTKFKEVYTSSTWLVRIFEVLDEPNREGVIDPPQRKFMLQDEPKYEKGHPLRRSGGPSMGERFEPEM